MQLCFFGDFLLLFFFRHFLFTERKYVRFSFSEVPHSGQSDQKFYSRVLIIHYKIAEVKAQRSNEANIFQNLQNIIIIIITIIVAILLFFLHNVFKTLKTLCLDFRLAGR